MKKLLLLPLLFSLAFMASAQFTDYSGNRSYSGLALFTQGTTVRTANLSQTGDGDSLIIRSAGDSCRIHATNKVSIDPTLQVNGNTILKGVMTVYATDSATRNGLTPVKGMMLYCTNCVGANDTTGVMQVYTGGSWLKLW